MSDIEHLKGKTVVITGAGRGLGAAFAIVLADHGAKVVLAARRQDALDEVAQAIEGRTGTRPGTIACDLADRASVEAAGKALAGRYAKIDVLINNGAQWLSGVLAENDADDIVSTVNSQVTGTLLLTRALIPALEVSGDGQILNIISISGLPNVALQGASPAFVAAKHGQTGLSDGLRQELRGRTIRVHAINPPMIEDVSPLDAGWQANDARAFDAWVTNRDVVAAGMFALTRPRHVTLSTVTLDSKTGGLHG
ncbi:MAG: SDR family NAD(P)-dependent oxidoreductase [Pseudomonadota bacterium]